MLNWIFWAIPREYMKRYFVTLWLVLFFLPGMLLGVRLTMLGLLVNFLNKLIIDDGFILETSNKKNYTIGNPKKTNPPKLKLTNKINVGVR